MQLRLYKLINNYSTLIKITMFAHKEDKQENSTMQQYNKHEN